MKKGDKVLYWDGDRGIVDKVWYKDGQTLVDITYKHNDSITVSTGNDITQLLEAGLRVISKIVIVIKE